MQKKQLESLKFLVSLGNCREFSHLTLLVIVQNNKRYTVQCIKINNITNHSGKKNLDYTALVRPILEYGAACWDPYKEGKIYALDRVQKKAAKFAHHLSEANWEPLPQCRKISRICALFKAYSGKRAWKFIGDRLQRPNYLSRIDHDWKIRNRRQRTDIGK